MIVTVPAAVAFKGGGVSAVVVVGQIAEGGGANANAESKKQAAGRYQVARIVLGGKRDGGCVGDFNCGRRRRDGGLRR